MNDSVQQFYLEDILEIIDLDKLKSNSLELSSYQKVLDYIELEKRRQEIGEKMEQYCRNGISGKYFRLPGCCEPFGNVYRKASGGLRLAPVCSG